MVQVPEEPVDSETYAEQVFFSLHHKVSMLYLRHTSSMMRWSLELFWMLLAVSGFAALICLHLAFVYRGNPAPSSSFGIRIGHHHPLRNIPSTCLPSIAGFRPGADVTHLVLLGDKAKESFAWELGRQAYFPKNETMECAPKTTKPGTAAWDAPTCANTNLEGGRVYFSFSKTKGFALLTPNLIALHNNHQGISTQIVAISRNDGRCFGESFLQNTVFHILGPDLVMINWLLAISNGTGYIYNPRKDKIVDLNQYSITNIRNSQSRGLCQSAISILSLSDWIMWFRPWASKLRTAVKTCLIYFISTNLVSFLLRVTQERLLELSIQIRSHQQENRSILPLFVVHLADCFVFIPIFIGVLFYLREFYQGDWVIALTFLAIVFICELFSAISVRTAQGMFFFPRAFFLLFCLVHFYLFSFPFGFSYVALGMIVCFMLQCTTFFWNRFEVPAVALGLVAPLNPRNSTNYSSNSSSNHSNGNHRRDNDFGSTRESVAPAVPRPRVRGSSSATRDHFHPNESGSREPISRAVLQPQYQRQQLHYTNSQGAFSQGILSRVSSEAIFPDDDNESCVYFLGGELVMRRRETQIGESSSGGNQSSNSVGDSAQLNRFDSTSTIQSSPLLGSITDGATISGLQSIYDMTQTDLTPRLSNTSREGALESSSGGAPVFPILGSTHSRGRRLKQQANSQ